MADNDQDWASERTQEKMLEMLQKAFKLDKDDSGKLNKALSEAAKNGGFIGKDAKKHFKAFTDGMKKETHARLESAAAFHKLPRSLDTFRERLEHMSVTMKAGLATAVTLGGILGMIGKRYFESVKMLKDMNEVGVNVNMTHMQLSKLLGKTGMSLDDFRNLTDKYTRVIAQNGIPAFTKLVAETGEVHGGFAKLGLTTADATEFVADYLDKQRALGIFSGATQTGLNQAIRRNIERLTAYSKILNVSRKEMMDHAKQRMGEDAVRRRFFAMDTKDRKKAMDAFNASLNVMDAFGEEGSVLADKFTDAMSRLNPQTSELVQGLRAVGPAGAEMAERILQWTKNVEKGIPVTADNIKELGKFIDANKQSLNQIGQSRSQYASLADWVGSFGFRVQEATKAGGKQTDKVNKSVEAMAELQNGINRLKESFLHLSVSFVDKLVKLIGGEGAEGTVAGGMKRLGEGLAETADYLLKLAGGDFSIWDVLKKAGKALWNGIEEGFTIVMTGLGNMIVNALDRVTQAIQDLNPFSSSHIPQKIPTIGRTTLNFGDFGNSLESRISLAEKRKNNIIADMQREANNQAIPQAVLNQHMARFTEQLNDVTTILYKLHQEQKKNTRVLEDNGNA